MRRRATVGRRIKRVGAQAAQHYLLVLLAILASFATWIAFLYLIGEQKNFWTSVLAGGFTNLWTFVVLYVLFIRRGIALSGGQPVSDLGALVGFHSRHEDVDWETAIRKARRIDIVVHYYNRWVREQSEAFTAVFERGGTVRLVMANPDSPATLECVNRHFFPRLTAQQLRDRIRETDARLEEFREASGSTKATLETFYYPEPLHYSFVLVDSRYLYISFYEQNRSPVIRSSVFELDLLLDGDLDTYWQNNVDHFIQASRCVRHTGPRGNRENQP